MKTVCKYLFLAALVCATGLFALSCKKETLSPEEQAKKEQEQAQKTEQFWDVVGQLVAASDIGQDYEGKTFEPVIGIADASDAQARIVKSNSAAAAAQSFANLVGVDTIDEDTPTYTWSNSEVGTLTYTKTDGTSSWAEVTVKIPTIPHLSKIIYRSVEQSGENGSFSYAAYYRFGDVVKRTNDGGIEEYWVCVRPAFGPEGKEDSHWMCVGSLPQKNIWTYTGSNKKEYAFPTGLKNSKEHMQNFAEMLYAMCYPKQWEQNILYYSEEGLFGPSGLPIFHDFHQSNVKYNNASFWNNVAVVWKEKGIDNLVLGTSLDNIAQQINGAGIHFLYKGYSWWTSTSNYATVYQAKFVNNPGGVNANMQTKTPYTDQKVQMIYKNQPAKDIQEFDVRNKKSVIYQDFFGDSSPRYIVRYAIASDLARDGKTPAVDQPIPGTEEVYRYYSDLLPIANVKEHQPEITEGMIVNDRQSQDLRNFGGIGHYSIGSILKDEKEKLWVVMNVAGQGNGLNMDYDCEAAPIAELVSFDGLSPDGKQVYGLSTFDQAIRAATYIRNYYGNGRNAFAQIDEDDRKIAEKVVKHVKDHTGWNLLDMVQATKGWGDARNLTQAFSVAYYEPEPEQYYKGKQPLFRFLYPISLDNAHTPYFFWQHYPVSPDLTAKSYDVFSSDLITLQDLANSQLVGYYATDFYATQPLENTDTDRNIRTQTDDAAVNNVGAFLYGSADWKNHLDMWNEPILMYRVDAVYDRGTEYATTTFDGHRLTLVAELKCFASPLNADALKGDLIEVYSFKNANDKEWRDGHMKLDGKTYRVPTWREAWNVNWN